MKRLTAIDAARGIASILVMLYHCNAVVQSPKYFADTPFGGFFGLAGVRMPFFFAMSGFMLALVHARDLGKPERLGRYLLGRFARIYPVYWLVLLIVVPIYLFRPEFGSEPGARSIGSILRSFLLWPQPGIPYLAVAWTLQSMVLFYAVYALAIWKRWLGFVVFGAWQTAILSVVALAIPLQFPWSFFLQTLYFNFLLGGLAAYAFARWKIAKPAVWFTVGIGLLGGFAFADFLGRPLFRFDRQLVVNGVASAVLLLGLAAWETATPLRVPRMLLAWGEASYSIFLIHYPLLSVFSKIGMALGLGRWLNGEAIFLIFAWGCIAVGVGFHRWVEKPVMLWTQARLGLAREKNSRAGVRSSATPQHPG